MDGDINYDSFGFIVIRALMHTRRGLPRADEIPGSLPRLPRRSAHVRPNARGSSPIPPSFPCLSLFLSRSFSHFHSTHLVSLVNFVLRHLRPTIRHSSRSPFPPYGLPSLTILSSPPLSLWSFISTVSTPPPPSPLSLSIFCLPTFLPSRFVTRCYA